MARNTPNLGQRSGTRPGGSSALIPQGQGVANYVGNGAAAGLTSPPGHRAMTHPGKVTLNSTPDPKASKKN